MSDEKVPERLNPWVLNGLLALVGVGFAGGMIALILALFPMLRPGMIQFTVGMGDIFFNHAEWVAKPEDPDEVLSVHWLSWDADGFRVPAWTSDRYPILALGDSFTEAANAPAPWTDILAREIGEPVRNLAFRGYGPIEQTEILRRYGVDSGAHTVVLGFFEGNDLANALSANPDNIPLPSDVEDFQIIPTDLENVTVSEPRYPMPIQFGSDAEVQGEIAFFEWYVWGLNAEYATFAESRALDISAQYWQTMRDLMPSACFVMVYFPAKPHVYVPYLTPDAQISLMSKAFETTLDSIGQFVNQDVAGQDFNQLLGRLGNLRSAVRDRAEAEGIPFFDLTPTLQNAAQNGEVVYYTYDTHWNQRGHDLVGAAIADYLKTNPCE